MKHLILLLLTGCSFSLIGNKEPKQTNLSEGLCYYMPNEEVKLFKVISAYSDTTYYLESLIPEYYFLPHHPPGEKMKIRYKMYGKIHEDDVVEVVCPKELK